MIRQADGCVDSRTVLVASGSVLFEEIVGHMVADCGFAAACPAPTEPAWVAISRAEPALVICDCAGPDASIRRLIVEVSARRLPLLMVWSQGQEDEYVRNLALPNRVAWITFPIEQGIFRSTIDDLLRPVVPAVHRLTLSGAGVTVDAALAVRTLDEVRPDVAIPKRTGRRLLRLLP